MNKPTIHQMIDYHLKNAEKFLRLNNRELYEWHNKRAKFYEKQRDKENEKTIHSKAL